MATIFEILFSKRNNIQYLHLKGPMDERAAAKLQDSIPKIEKSCIINLSGITHINSIGAIGWVRFMGQLNHREISLEECSVDFVIQITCIHGFTQNAKVLSIMTQYFCDDCHEDEIKLTKISSELVLKESLRPTYTCAHCGGTIRMGDHPESFLQSILKAS